MGRIVSDLVVLLTIECRGYSYYGMADDRPVDAGAPEIEVTSEMIEAGLRTLWKSGAVECPTALDRNLVRTIYLAMVDARPA